MKWTIRFMFIAANIMCVVVAFSVLSGRGFMCPDSPEPVVDTELMLWSILIVVCLLVIVQVVGLYWRIRMGGRIEREHFTHFNCIGSKLDELWEPLMANKERLVSIESRLNMMRLAQEAIEGKLDKADKQLMIFVDLITRLVEVLEKKDED